MNPGRKTRLLLLPVLAPILAGCVARTWEDAYSITEAAPPVGSHYRRSYKYGEAVLPAVNPRLKVEGEELRLLLDQIRTR